MPPARTLVADVVALLAIAVLATGCAATPGTGDGSAPDDPATSAGPTASGAARTDALPDVPDGWPDDVELGMSSGLGDAADLRASAPFGFRYQYLAGGVHTGDGWAGWHPDGAFVTDYIDESRAAGMIPVFTYYMLFQSLPGRDLGEPDGVYANLTNRRTMAAYYTDLELFFERAGAAGGTTVFHVEPDLWAFLQQRAVGDDAATVRVAVDASGMDEVAGLADNAAGLAQAVVRLRDRHAPNVVLAYHFSTWGTGTEILNAGPSDAEVRALGARTAAFYDSLDAAFDIAFTDIADRDAAFKQEHYGDRGASWMDDDDYHRSAVYIDAFVDAAGVRAVLWQLPLGNTRMRAVDNTWGHYQDNKVERLLDGPRSATLVAYLDAGVVALLFGGGAAGTTCACDARDDGVTNPPPINGNDARSLSADDDGGFFRDRAAAYYAGGAVPLGE